MTIKVAAGGSLRDTGPTGKQTDIKVKNLIKIAHALGYELVLEKGDERLTLHECVQDGVPTHISAVSMPHFAQQI